MTDLTDLDRQLLAVLNDMQVCSHVPAATNAGGGGTEEALGGGRPPGDLGAEEYARRYGPPFHACTTRCDHYGPARDDDDRRRVIAMAKDELKAILGDGAPAPATRPTETAEQLAERIVKDGEGWTVKQCAVHFRCLERTVIKARRDDGRDTELGHEPPAERLPPDQRRRRVAELARQDLNVRQIARRLGEHPMTISRDLALAKTAANRTDRTS